MKGTLPKLQTTVYNLLQKATLLLFVYMPFHTFISVWLSTYTGGLDYWKVWKDILTALVTILCIVLVLLTSKPIKLYKNLLCLVAIYAFIHVVLFFTTNQPELTGVLSLTYNLRIFCYLIIGFSLAILLPKASLEKYYLKILILISTIVCLLALAQFLLPRDIMTNFGYAIDRGVKPNFFIDDKSDLFRVFSSLRDPNSLGAFLILPIIFLIQKFIKYFKTEKKLFLGGLLLLHIWVLLLTFSRSALLATTLAATTLLVMQNLNLIKKYKQKIIIYSLASLVTMFGLVFIFRDQYFVQNVIFHADESTVLADSNELRVNLARKAIDGIVDEPFGHGPGTAGLVSTRLPNGLLTENYFLQILYEVGIFGFAVFIAILFLIIQKLWYLRKNDTAKIMLASFVGLFFMNLLLHIWAIEGASISWFMISGILLAKNLKLNRQSSVQLSKVKSAVRKKSSPKPI